MYASVLFLRQTACFTSDHHSFRVCAASQYSDSVGLPASCPLIVSLNNDWFIGTVDPIIWRVYCAYTQL